MRDSEGDILVKHTRFGAGGGGRASVNQSTYLDSRPDHIYRGGLRFYIARVTRYDPDPAPPGNGGWRCHLRAYQKICSDEKLGLPVDQ